MIQAPGNPNQTLRPRNANPELKPSATTRADRKRHNRIADMFGRLKDWRWVTNHCNPFPSAFLSTIALAATVPFWLQA